MNLEFIKPQNLGSLLMKSSQSNFDLRSPSSYLARSYLIATVNRRLKKFIYSEKTTKFCEIFTLLLSYVVPVKSKVKISQNFVAFSEYMNFTSLKPVVVNYSNWQSFCTMHCLVTLL